MKTWRTPPECRAAGGSDSGTTKNTASASTAVATVITVKTSRQSPSASTTPPRDGASTGDTPVIIIM